MQGDGRLHDGGLNSAELAIADLRASADRTIGEWSDAQLDAVIARLRQDSPKRPDNFALRMFLEDARLRRHEQRIYCNGKGNFAERALPSV